MDDIQFGILDSQDQIACSIIEGLEIDGLGFDQAEAGKTAEGISGGIVGQVASYGGPPLKSSADPIGIAGGNLRMK